ncbi:MAG: hydrolase [Gammaproteobacteria bacterium]|nr:hydrolase [Gammaproteobacteria bacterium]MDH3435236.1 hydrolase [Gammaproteobacteria bacterium]
MTTDTTRQRLICSDFKPARWLKHRHLQTIFPSLPWAWRQRVELRREILELPDGDDTAVDWLCAADALPRSAPLLVILHGLEGSAASSYARMLMQAAYDRGWRPCVLHMRDCGDFRNRLPRRYHAGETNDIRFFLKTLQSGGQSGPMFAVGYSLGGNILLKYLGESGNDSRLAAAGAVCVPLDLHKCAEALNIGFSKIYQRHLLNNMKNSLRRKFDSHTAAFDWELAMKAETFAEFDDAVTAPLHGFENMNDYYDKCSSGQFLKNIERPTLIINSLDDPFMTPGVIPDEDRLSDAILLEIAEAGGHVGFIEGGTPWRPQYYLPRRLLDFLQEQQQI